MSKPQLGYWKIRGLAAPIRRLLHYVGQNFEDVQYELGDAPEFNTESWTSVKNTLGLDFPNLPYYIDGEIRITQSNAIVRYIASKHDLLGKTDKERAYCEMMLENAMDLRNSIIRMVYNPSYERLAKVFASNNLKGLLDGLENWLTDKKWFAGNNLSAADFPYYELLDQLQLMFPNCFKDYPKLTAFLDAFENLPAIKKYHSSPEYFKHPINNKNGFFK